MHKYSEEKNIILTPLLCEALPIMQNYSRTFHKDRRLSGGRAAARLPVLLCRSAR